MTYKELYHELGKLTEEQFEQQVCLSDDNEQPLLSVGKVTILEEDFVIDGDGLDTDSISPLSEYEGEDPIVVWDKDSVFLDTVFYEVRPANTP